MPLALAHIALRASLPQLDGSVKAPSIAQAVQIERDSLGIPTIKADNRLDLAYATGFVHAQDRFFQMDLSRRLAAGELTGLFGDVAAAQDEKARVFEFRSVAKRVLGQATQEQRAFVAAYTRGVNTSLAHLGSRPWEYWVLRARPAQWRDEDSILVVHAMWWDLQYSGFRREQLRHQIDERAGGPVTSAGWKRVTCFLYAPRSSWDAPNQAGGAGAFFAFKECAAVPSADELNVRASVLRAPSIARSLSASDDFTPMVGSNNWAVAGSLTPGGGALVANDMHLGLRVPTTWYRARLQTGALDLNGLTLPGAPVLVAGSNGHIAWGFSNSYGDWLDLVTRACDAHGHGVKFSGPDGQGRCEFAQWLATDPEATNLRLLDFEKATSVEQALRLAPQIGIPHQNLIVGDRDGHIGWTIAGRIPRGVDAGRNDGSSGWLNAGEQPQIFDPGNARLWAANARSTDDLGQEQAIGADEAILGAEYDLGARAQQIRDDLRAVQRDATPANMLAIQLDDRARFLARWRDLALRVLDADAQRGKPARQHFVQLISHWEGRASTNSVSYRLVRAFHDRTEARVWVSILQALGMSTDDAPAPARFEEPLWTLVTVQPLHMLPARYAGWREFLLAQVDSMMAEEEKHCVELTRCTWGTLAPVRVRHPLSNALPLLSPLLDMPELQLPGDRDMPRVQGSDFGASERFAVTPGLESQGYLHIAGGQSGHPLSPYYRTGFKEWAEGQPLPFLPGPRQHRLVLTPR